MSWSPDKAKTHCAICPAKKGAHKPAATSFIIVDRKSVACCGTCYRKYFLAAAIERNQQRPAGFRY